MPTTAKHGTGTALLPTCALCAAAHSPCRSAERIPISAGTGFTRIGYLWNLREYPPAYQGKGVIPYYGSNTLNAYVNAQWDNRYHCALGLALDQSGRVPHCRGAALFTPDMACSNARLIAKPDVFRLSDLV